jgi:hypothetical protein
MATHGESALMGVVNTPIGRDWRSPRPPILLQGGPGLSGRL